MGTYMLYVAVSYRSLWGMCTSASIGADDVEPSAEKNACKPPVRPGGFVPAVGGRFAPTPAGRTDLPP